MNKLLIVESPAKAKTIKKYLGPGFEVTACMGHVRDLPKSKIGIDVNNDFKPDYVEMAGKEDVLKQLKNLASKSDSVLLATDPDREGEAISWHLAHILALNEHEPLRVTFNEITKTAVIDGVNNPRVIDEHLVNAQQTRRLLDRIVGYKLSPFLWKKVKRGLSAGRVQSVAVKIIVDRELEIRAFTPVEYWSIDAKLFTSAEKKLIFDSKLHSKIGEKKIEVSNEKDAEKIYESVKNADFVVNKISKGIRNRQSAPPFITSSLQQEASRKFGFTGQRTMRAAQQLYEGIDVAGQGSTGLITYMRTDSLRVAADALSAAKSFISKTYGDNYLPASPRVFKSKKNSQEGHEAIRPTDVYLTPAKVKDSLSLDQYKIYKLIWDRLVASQMAPCVQNTVKVDIHANDYLFRSSGYTVKFDGFTVLYEESKDEISEDGGALPNLTEGEKLNLKDIVKNQHFTQPPARYTDASLIKVLEENGIGRPSTYAPTISTILARDYVNREKRTLFPTPLGEAVTELMKEQFKDIVDVDFTANLEDNLDKIEENSADWVKTLREFYNKFIVTLENAEKAMDGIRVKVKDIESDIDCELCGKRMVIKSGRFGKFLACPGFPDCKCTKPIAVETPGECPLCGGKILERKSGKGYKYFVCEKSPDCKFITWDVPTKDKCPDCDKSLFKRRGGIIVCLDEACGFEKVPEKKTKATAKSTTKKTTAAKKSTAKATTTKKTTTKKTTTAKKPAVKKTTAKKAKDE